MKNTDKFKEIDFEALGRFLTGESPKDEKDMEMMKANCEKFKEAYEEVKASE